MSRYDGLIIPRSYSEYINKTDAATLQQALQLSGVLSGAVAAGDNKAVTSNAVNVALANYDKSTKITMYGSQSVDVVFSNRVVLVTSSMYAGSGGAYLICSNYNTDPLVIRLGATNFDVQAVKKENNVATITVYINDKYSWSYQYL